MEKEQENHQDEKNYLEFKTEDDFNNHISEYIQDYQTKIAEQEDEIKKLKVKDTEIKKLNTTIDIFTSHLLKKYEVNKSSLDTKSFDYSSYENLEKSILKQLENKNINYKKSQKQESNQNKPKIYL